MHGRRLPVFLAAIALVCPIAGCTRHTDLFACDISSTCEPMDYHLDPGPGEALACAGKLIEGRGRGAFLAIENPGPYVYETEQLIIALGDGTALVQSRHRECECSSAPDWEPLSAHQICKFVLDPSCEVGQCLWSPWGPGGLAGCRDVEDRTCADVAAMLE